MVVIKRAMKDGRDAAYEAKLTLIANTPAAQPLLLMLPEEGALPSMKDLEGEASDLCRNGLSVLVDVCTEARCQPLEMFTRSVECTVCKAALRKLTANGEASERRQQRPQQCGILPLSWYQETERALQQLGATQSMAALIVSFLKVYKHLLTVDPKSAEYARADLIHMLPGNPSSRCLWHHISFP